MGFAPPPRDGFALLAAHKDALTCRHISSACYECTIFCLPAPRNTPRKISPHLDDASVLLCVTRFPLALLPSSDESAMNFEDLGIPFRANYCFPQHFCESRANVAENICTQSFRSPIPCKSFGDVGASCAPVGTESGTIGSLNPR